MLTLEREKKQRTKMENISEKTYRNNTKLKKSARQRRGLISVKAKIDYFPNRNFDFLKIFIVFN